MQQAQPGGEKRRVSLRWLIIIGIILLQLSLIITITLQPHVIPDIKLEAVVGKRNVCRIVEVAYPSSAWDQGLRVGMYLTLDNPPPGNCVWGGFAHVEGQDTSVLIPPVPQRVSHTDLFLAAILVLVFDLTGAAIFLRMLNLPIARIAALLFLCTALTICLYALRRSDLVWTQFGLFALSSVTRGLSTTFVCLFPYLAKRERKRRWSRFFLSLPLLVGVVLGIATPLLNYLSPSQIGLVIQINLLYNVICLGVVLWIFGWGLRELPRSERPLVRMIIIGVVFLLLPLALSLNAFQENLTTLPSLVRLIPIPLTILPLLSNYAMFRSQLLGQTSLFSRRIMRVLLWFLLASLFLFPALILLGLLNASGMLNEERHDYLYATFLLLSLWLFPLAWTKVREVGDTLLYRDFYQYNRSLREISTSLTQLQGLDQICAFLLPRLTTLLNASDATLIIRTCSGETHPFNTPGISGQGDRPTWYLYQIQASKTVLAREQLRSMAELAMIRLKQPCDEPFLIEGVLLTPLYDGEQVNGFLCLGPKHNLEPYNRQDKSFLATLVAQLTVLEVNSRYLERAQADALQLAALSRRVVSAQEEERRHLSLELHDEALQQAMLLSRQLSDAQDMTEVAESMPLVRSVVASLRRTCLELRPPLLDELGLLAALNWLAKQNEQLSGQRVRIRLVASSELFSERLSAPTELALYRITQEALTNVLKHANAHEVTIRLRHRSDGALTLLVCDNGHGFRAKQRMTERLGLVGMSERIHSVGGTIMIRSTPGRGTCVRVIVPKSALDVSVQVI